MLPIIMEGCGVCPVTWCVNVIMLNTNFNTCCLISEDAVICENWYFLNHSIKE